MSKIHHVAGGVITADPWYRAKVLLMRRSPYKKRWPGRWSYLTEHIKEGETSLEALERGIREETGLSSILIVKGPVLVEKTDPDHYELFEIELYQCVLSGYIPHLNVENTHYTWVSPFFPLWDHAPIRLEPKVLDGFYDDLERLGIGWSRL